MSSLENIVSDSNLIRKDWLPLEEAIQRVVQFERKFGTAHMAFACHAALPSILTPVLVNLIRINFLEKAVEWVAENDLLLSSLCNPIDRDIFEVEPKVREVLLVELKTNPTYGLGRLEELAMFLRDYTESQQANKLPAHIRRTYSWIANAFIEPDETVSSMFDFLKDIKPEERSSKLTAQLEVGKIVEMVAEPLGRTNLQVELENVVYSTQLLSHYWYGDKEVLEGALRSDLNDLDEVTDVLSTSIANWIITSENITIDSSSLPTLTQQEMGVASMPVLEDFHAEKQQTITGLTWLHLSDWHQGSKDFNRSVARDALLRDIGNRVNINPDLAKIDLLIFSGDVALSGKAEEYNAAIDNFFQPVLDATGLSRDQLFIVPGNHDLDREKLKDLSAGIDQPISSERQIRDWLRTDLDRKQILQPFAAYEKFARELTNQAQPAYSNIRSFTIGGKQVALLGLNSALMSGRNKDARGAVEDFGLLVVGEPQIYEPLKEIAGTDIRIAVIHHPFEWLAEFDRHSIEDRLRSVCHFVLHGHQHKPIMTLGRETGSDCMVIPAGASCGRRFASDPRYANSYNFVHLDLETEQGTVYFRIWSERRNEWVEDIDAYKGGSFKFSLPKSSLPARSPSVTPSNPQKVPQRSPSPLPTLQEEQASPVDKKDLFDRLTSCSPGVFSKVVLKMKPPDGVLSPARKSQASRAAELIEWAEHPAGPGLKALFESYLQATGNQDTIPPQRRKEVYANTRANVLRLKENLEQIQMLLLYEVKWQEITQQNIKKFQSDISNMLQVVVTLEKMSYAKGFFYGIDKFKMQLIAIQKLLASQYALFEIPRKNRKAMLEFFEYDQLLQLITEAINLIKLA